METANLIYKLRKINREYTFNIWRVRVGGFYMALFFLFEIGSMLVGKFVPMSPEMKNVVCETMSCIACLILGEEILRSLYKLLPRYRWATLLAMAFGAMAGLLFSVIFDLVDGAVIPKNDYIALGVTFALAVASFVAWRISVRKVKEIKLEREMARKRRIHRGY